MYAVFGIVVRDCCAGLTGLPPLVPVWGFAPQPRLVSTVCLTYKINYSIIRGKMQVKFSGENHGFLWQNVKLRYAFTTQRKNAKISITLLRIRKELRL